MSTKNEVSSINWLFSTYVFVEEAEYDEDDNDD